jgi:hypothetical protein
MVKVPNRHYIFTHPQTDTIFALPILLHRKNIALMNYRTIYNIIDKRGIMGKEAFQALLIDAWKKDESNNEQVETPLDVAKVA